MDDFEWDSAKAAANLSKHRISFEDAADALDGLGLTRSNSKLGEKRFRSICSQGDMIIVVIWTVRGNATRLISARRARINEREQYRQAVTKAAQAR